MLGSIEHFFYASCLPNKMIKTQIEAQALIRFFIMKSNIKNKYLINFLLFH